MVEITFKLLSQESFKLDLQPQLTIGEVKKIIEDQRGAEENPVELQKLLFNGKVLQDEQTVGECNLDSAKFVVLMISKRKAPAPMVAAPAAPAVEEEKPIVEPPRPQSSTPIPSPVRAANAAAAAAAASATAPATAAAPTAVDPGLEAIPAEYAGSLDALISMGYPRDQAEIALRAAFYNADRAVDYLLNGVPDNLVMAAAPADIAPGIVEAASGRPAPNANADARGGLNALRDIPQFDQIREMIRSHPDMLPELLAQIAQSNPQMMEMIASNQDEFRSLLNEVIMESPSDEEAEGSDFDHDDDDDDDDDDESFNAAEAPAHEDPEEALRQRGVARIQVTPEENAAIERLKGMGFPEALVIEAFFACDKNEDLAVNYILARMDEAADAFNE